MGLVMRSTNNVWPKENAGRKVVQSRLEQNVRSYLLL